MDTGGDQAYHSGLSYSEDVSTGPVPGGTGKTAGKPCRGEMLKLLGVNRPSSGAPDTRAGGLMLAINKGVALSAGLHAASPTTRLAGQLDSIAIARITRGDGVELSSLASSTSDYASGNFSSLAESDRGYASMSSLTNFMKVDDKECMSTTSQLHSLPQSSDSDAGARDSLGNRQMEVNDNTDISMDKVSKFAMTKKTNITSTLIFEGKESKNASMVCGEGSSAVPAIAESIEIITDVSAASPSAMSSLMMEQTKQESGGGVLSKRSAGGHSEADAEPSRKNPRLNHDPASGNWITNMIIALGWFH